MVRLPDHPASVALLNEYLEAMTLAGLTGLVGELANLGALDDAIELEPASQRFKPYRELMFRTIIRLSRLEGTAEAKRSLIIQCVGAYLRGTPPAD
jgi:hypothetical protein